MTVRLVTVSVWMLVKIDGGRCEVWEEELYEESGLVLWLFADVHRGSGEGRDGNELR